MDPTPPDPCNLIVNYIPTPIRDEELGDLFSPFGNIIEARVIFDRVTGAHRGFGFVKFETLDSALAAVAALNCFEIYGKRLKVAQARPQTALELKAAAPPGTPAVPAGYVAPTVAYANTGAYPGYPVPMFYPYHAMAHPPPGYALVPIGVPTPVATPQPQPMPVFPFFPRSTGSTGSSTPP